MYDLNSLVTNLASAGFEYLETAYAVNDSDWVVGEGIMSGSHASAGFIAQVTGMGPPPVPEPGTLAVGLLCIGVSMARRRCGCRGFPAPVAASR